MAAVVASCGLISTPLCPFLGNREGCHPVRDLKACLVSIFRCSGRMWSMLVTRAHMSPLSFFTLSRMSLSSVTTWLRHGNTSLNSALNLQSESWNLFITGLFGCHFHHHAHNPGVPTIQLELILVPASRQTKFSAPKSSTNNKTKASAVTDDS